MQWLDTTRSILADFKASTGIPSFWRRCEAPTTQLPDTYIVYFMVDDIGESWANNRESLHQPKVQISLYFRNKAKYLTVPDQIKAAFMAANFMRQTENELPYQTETGHYGWYCDFNFLERR